VRTAVAIAAALSVAAPHSGPAHPRPHKFFGGVVSDGATTGPPRAHIANLPYGGGPVLHSNRTHLIFWEPSGSGLGFDPGYQPLIEMFMADVAADSHQPTNVYALSGQYRDAAGPAAYDSSYGGVVVATDPLPANGCIEPLGPPLGPGPGWARCLTDQQLQAEVVRVVAAGGLPQAGGDIYFLITPNGLGSCLASGPQHCALGGVPMSGYCGYHSVTQQGLPYAVIPYNALPGHCKAGEPRPNASTADPALSAVSHEHNEMITDPYGNAWIDTSFQENGDLCNSSFGPILGGAGTDAYTEAIGGHHYYLQEEWSNDDSSCQPRDEADQVSFSMSRRLRSGRSATFTAGATDPDGQIVAYGWSFGDGRNGDGRRASHTFRRPGQYTVTLRATDSAGNWAAYTKTVRVSRR
jgi:hypothetical protein